MADPNWFLSTASQSSAAIVGLVGGFIFMRLFGFLAERYSLQSRVDEKRAVVSRLQDELRKATDELDTFSAEAFMEYVNLCMKDKTPIPTLDEVLNRRDLGTHNLTILRPMYDSWRDNIMGARQFFESKSILLPRKPMPFVDWLNQNDLDLTGIDNRVAEYVFNKVVSEIESPSFQEKRRPVKSTSPIEPSEVRSILVLCLVNSLTTDFGCHAS